MKIKNWLVFTSFMLGGLFVVSQEAYFSLSQLKNSGMEQKPISMSTADTSFSPIWRRSCQFTLEVAQKMPEDTFDFQPQGDVLSFKSQLLHIVDNLRSLRRFNFPEEEMTLERVGNKEWTKEQSLSLFTESCTQVLADFHSFDEAELAETVPFWAETPINRMGVFMLMRDHMAHHRGQMVLYLRLNGIKPPGYVGW